MPRTRLYTWGQGDILINLCKTLCIRHGYTDPITMRLDVLVFNPSITDWVMVVPGTIITLPIANA